MQEKARLQSQEEEAIKSMSRQEQAEAEKKYQQEVGKNVELTDKLRDAVKDQVSFNVWAKGHVCRTERHVLPINSASQEKTYTDPSRYFYCIIWQPRHVPAFTVPNHKNKAARKQGSDICRRRQTNEPERPRPSSWRSGAASGRSS